MNFGKLFISASAAAVLMTFVVAGRPTAAFAAPQLTIQSEEAAHPRLVHAIHNLQDVLKELDAAPDDFGFAPPNQVAATNPAISAAIDRVFAEDPK